MTNRGQRILKIVLVGMALISVSLAVLWYRFRPDERGRVIPPFESIDMEALPPFVKQIQGAAAVTVFEGLPHQMWEHGLLESERATKAVFDSHGYSFYTSPMVPSPEDVAILSRLAADTATFHEWAGMKLCGGYHPDWLIRWTSQDGSHCELHLCFGCHEAKIYGPKQLYCDVASGPYGEFKAVLDRYQNQRPIKKPE